MKKRTIGGLLAMGMVFTTVSMTALAENGTVKNLSGDPQAAVAAEASAAEEAVPADAKHRVDEVLTDRITAGESLEDHRAPEGRYGDYQVSFYEERWEPGAEELTGEFRTGNSYYVRVEGAIREGYALDSLSYNNLWLFYDEEEDCYYSTYSILVAEEADTLVEKLLASGTITYRNAIAQGTAAAFDNETMGIGNGILLDTSGKIPETETDEDLEAAMENPYGGDTASLQFDLEATGSLLQVKYAFASMEFACDPEYNDSFAIFASVSKDGGETFSEPENIAVFRDENDEEQAVSLNALRKACGEEDPAYFEDCGEQSFDPWFTCNNAYGCTSVFTAEKKVEAGDVIRLKFVICDGADTSIDSWLAIQGGSVSFTDAEANG